MSAQSVDSTVLIPKAPLIRLMQVGVIDVDGGQPTPCYINPELISCMYRSSTVYTSPADAERKSELVTGTVIGLNNGQYVRVIESPDKVALMREKALGNKPTIGLV